MISPNSWKTIQFDLVANTVSRIDLEKVFDGKNLVRPNFIQIKNLNSSDILYVGDDKLVSSSNYRLSINPLSTGKSINIDSFSDIYFLIATNTTGLNVNYAYDDAPSASDMDGTQETTVINQSLTVGNVGISSIAAGDNNIGNVDIASIGSGCNVGIIEGGHQLVVEADGSINVNGATFNGTIGTVKLEDETGTYFLDIDSSGYITANINGSIPAGDNNIGNVDIASAIPAGDNNIGNVDLASSIPAGDNNIGNVDLASSIPAGDNNIGNVDIVTVGSGQNLKPATTPTIYNDTLSATPNTESSQALSANTKKFSIGLQSKNPAVTWQLKFGASGTSFYLSGDETVTEDNILLASQTLYYEADTGSEVIQIMEWV